MLRAKLLNEIFAKSITLFSYLAFKSHTIYNQQKPGISKARGVKVPPPRQKKSPSGDMSPPIPLRYASVHALMLLLISARFLL